MFSCMNSNFQKLSIIFNKLMQSYCLRSHSCNYLNFFIWILIFKNFATFLINKLMKSYCLRSHSCKYSIFLKVQNIKIINPTNALRCNYYNERFNINVLKLSIMQNEKRKKILHKVLVGMEIFMVLILI